MVYERTLPAIAGYQIERRSARKTGKYFDNAVVGNFVTVNNKITLFIKAYVMRIAMLLCVLQSGYKSGMWLCHS
jgi:hypothetical protein